MRPFAIMVYAIMGYEIMAYAIMTRAFMALESTMQTGGPDEPADPDPLP